MPTGCTGRRREHHHAVRSWFGWEATWWVAASPVRSRRRAQRPGPGSPYPGMRARLARTHRVVRARSRSRATVRGPGPESISSSRTVVLAARTSGSCPATGCSRARARGSGRRSTATSGRSCRALRSAKRIRCVGHTDSLGARAAQPPARAETSPGRLPATAPSRSAGAPGGRFARRDTPALDQRHVEGTLEQPARSAAHRALSPESVTGVLYSGLSVSLLNRCRRPPRRPRRAT